MNLLSISFLWCSSRFCSWSSSFHTIHLTTPLNFLISHSTVNHHLYADDTQLIIINFFFSSSFFLKYLLLLQDTISKVSAWMSSNMLSLNHSKTEFLLIGLPKQLSKMSNPLIQMSPEVSLFPVSTARNLGAIFDSTLCVLSDLFCLQILSSSYSWSPSHPQYTWSLNCQNHRYS